MSRSRRWIVTLAEGASAAELRTRLDSAGFEVDQVLDEIGVVTGRGDDAVAAQVREIDGVEDVSPEGEIGIGPPDSDLW